MTFVSSASMRAGFSACFSTAVSTCGYGSGKRVGLAKKGYGNAKPYARSQEAKQEIVKLREGAVENFQKLAEFEVKASFARQRLTKKEIKVREARSLKSKRDSVVEFYNKEKKSIDQKIEALKNVSVLKKLGDRVIVFFRFGMVQSRCSKISMLESKLESVEFYLIGFQKELEAATGNEEVLAKKFASHKSKLNSSVDEMADFETDIIAKLAAGFEGEINSLGGRGCKIRAAWDASWEKSLGGKGSKVTELGKEKLKRVRDNRWDVLCKRVCEKSEVDKQSVMKEDLNDVKSRITELNQELQSIDELRVEQSESYRAAREVVEEKAKELGVIDKAIKEIKIKIEVKNNVSDKVENSKYLKEAEGEVKALEKELEELEGKMKDVKAELTEADGKLRDATVALDTAVKDVERVKTLISENREKKMKLKKEIDQIDSVLKKTRFEIDEKRKAIANEQLDYLKSKLQVSDNKDSLSILGWSQSLLGIH